MIVRSEEKQRELTLRSAQQSVAALLRLVWPVWKWGPLEWGPHIDVGALVFEQWARGLLVDDPERLGLPIEVVACQPPGTTKTVTYGRLGLLWMLLQKPSLRLLHASHTIDANLTKVDEERMQAGRSQRYRDLVDASSEPWRWGKAESNEQTTTAGGGIALASWQGGAATSRHFNGHYYDDLCTAKDVFSDTARAAWRRQIDELGSRFAQRLKHIFFSMQRLAWNDPVADFLKEYPDALQLVLPRVFEKGRTDYPEQLDLGVPSEWTQAAFDGETALAPYRERLERAGFWLEQVDVVVEPLEGEPFEERQRRLHWRDWRRDGEHLQPVRFGPKEEKKARRNLRRWLAEQQQRPSKGQGVAIVSSESWRSWSTTPASQPGDIVIAMDPQSGDPSKRATPDRTAVLVGARWGGLLHLLERVNGEHTFTQRCALIWLLARRWVPHRILVEDANGGSDHVAHLQGEGLPLMLVKPEGSTAGRLMGASGSIIAGNVLVPSDGAARPSCLRADEPWPGRVFTYDEVPSRLRPAPGHVEALPMPIMPAPAIWRPEFVEAIASIPGGLLDDDGDTTAYIIRDVQQRLGERDQERDRTRRRRAQPQTAARRHGVANARPRGRLRHG